MSNANDNKILLLQEQIKQKKSAITKKRFAPITNCTLELEENRYNLNGLQEEQLTLLLIKLNAYVMSMKQLSITKCVISGYAIEDWVSDIKSRLEVLSQRNQENELSALEKKLSSLLSSDKKTSLELDNIEAILNQ
jgi:hypothetical protein